VRGFEGGKRLAGRQRHILVDTHGCLLAVVVHAANIPDRAGSKLVLEALRGAFPRLQRIGADPGDTGALLSWVAQQYGITLDVVYPASRQLQRYAPELVPALGYAPGFRVIPKRWIVERTCSWLSRQRRLTKDYERLPSTAEALIYLVGIPLLLARLARS
jgi:putative transposase